MAGKMRSGTVEAGQAQGSDPAVLALSVLAVGISTARVGARLLARRRTEKSVTSGAGRLAIDTAKALHEKAWNLTSGGQTVPGVQHQLDLALADVSALLLDMGESGRAPYEGPSFEERLRVTVDKARAAFDRFDAFTAEDPERAMEELNSTRDFLETTVRPQLQEAGEPWVSEELESQWRHLNWEPYRFIRPGGGAAAFAQAVERYLGEDRSDEDLVAALAEAKGELEDRRDCVYVIGLLIDFTVDLAEGFGAAPAPGAPRGAANRKKARRRR
ncbi:hypothetical protein ACX80W_00155 [Arthrobacter sp. TMN-37]